MPKSFYIFLIAACLLSKSSRSQTAYWQQQVDFKMSVSLNDVKHTLDAFETIQYTNNSPDTLSFIWFHLWPNAYKNDKTAFSEQMVDQLDNSSFYFSQNKDRGYINKLDFKVDGQVASTEDHPQYIDIVKLLLPAPLLPGQSISITTPFHEKIPKNFSRGGHIGQSYQLTQWYPKPAVYDRTGWHPMPYLDQGEFFNEFGNYEVAITLPSNYVVAATGALQEEAEKSFLASRGTSVKALELPKVKKDIFVKTKTDPDQTPASAPTVKTIHYQANNVIDFAWFADKRFLVTHALVNLPTNPSIDVYNFVLPSKEALWKNSVDFTTRAVRFYSDQLGDYPYPVVNVVCAPEETTAGGMEYPNITLLNVPGKDARELDITIAHEVGHNWLQAMLATNERDHPWMDEGMNTYYEKKYDAIFYNLSTDNKSGATIAARPADNGELALASLISQQKDQPIESASETFTKRNYTGVAYTKSALWMEKLEQAIGTGKMKEVMKAYFAQWKMKHPYPEDFKKVAETTAGENLDRIFNLLYTTGSLEQPPPHKPVKVSVLFSPKTTRSHYISLFPAAGFNAYDKLMIGALLTNIVQSSQPFNFAIAPLYATGSKQLTGAGFASFTIFPREHRPGEKRTVHSITPAIAMARFNTDDGEGDQYQKLYRGFFKVVPSIRLDLSKKTLTSNISKWIEWKSFFISEGQFNYEQRRAPQDTFQYFATKTAAVKRWVHQLSAGVANSRHLYPYDAVLQIQQAGNLVSTTLTGNYYFNYNEHQGVNIRFFAGKIWYTQTKTDKIRFSNSRYHFTMYGANGDDDYTYSNAFIDRNQNTNFTGKQIMIRDGGFKYRSDYSSERPGRTDNWLAAVNLAFDVPTSINPLAILPVQIPLKLFADIGTYAEAWEENTVEPRFLYSIGLQLPVFKYVNIYWTIIQSNVFKAPNELNGVKWWQKNVTFSVDIQHLKPQLSGNKFL